MITLLDNFEEKKKMAEDVLRPCNDTYTEFENDII